MKIVKIIQNKRFAEAKEELLALSEFVYESFGDKKQTYLKKAVSGELAGSGYNEVGVERIDDNIIISFDIIGAPEVIIPVDKFIDFIEQLSAIAYLRWQEIKPKEIIFTFDDEWNCDIEFIHLNFFEKLLLKLRKLKRFFQKSEPRKVIITRYKCFFDEYENRYSVTPSSRMMSPVACFVDDVFGKEQLPELKKLLDDEITTHVSGIVRQEKKGESIIIINEYYGYPKITLPKDKFVKLLEKLDSIAHFKHAHAKDKPKKIILTFDNKWNCEIEVIK